MGRLKTEYRDPLLRKTLTNLARNLFEARTKSGLNQQDLATRAKISSSTVSEIERKDARDLRLSTLTALARVLDVDISWLLRRHED
jgi:transcriptional regulator with XRE-family HTH domain